MEEETHMATAELAKNPANYTTLTPLTFIARAALAHPDRTAVIYGDIRRSWAETYRRCLRLASALQALGVGPGDTVAALLPNVPEMLELHFAVPMLGAVLNAQNTRLDARTIGYMLDHGKAKVFFTDTEYHQRAAAALSDCRQPPLVIDVCDPHVSEGRRIGRISYDELLSQGSEEFRWQPPEDEWHSITLNYTSGTTGDPKGVVYHHRGAYLNALSNVIGLGLPSGAVYLWTLPMFHCNGWCFPWAVTAVAGTHVCLRQVQPERIFEAIRAHEVTHFCAAPVVLTMLVNAAASTQVHFAHPVTAATGGAAPPAAIIEAMEKLGIRIVHLYGLTETYGPSVICEFQDTWAGLPLAEKAGKIARQGILSLSMTDMMVADPATLEPVPRGGATIGELFLRGSTMMKGYLNDPEATAKAFAGGWFHTGDLGVWHPDGYVEIKDRSKDIIISGGENISSIEVENVLYRHPAVLEAAVVAMPDPFWGEVPCAFIAIKQGQALDEEEVVRFCKANLAGFKCPKKVIFLDELPKTSTGKIQKHVLRSRLAAMSA